MNMTIEDRIGKDTLKELELYIKWAPGYKIWPSSGSGPSYIRIRYQAIEILWKNEYLENLYVKISRTGLAGKLGFKEKIDLNAKSDSIPWIEIKNKVEEIVTIAKEKYNKLCNDHQIRIQRAIRNDIKKSTKRDGALSEAEAKGGELSGPEVWG